MVHDDVLLDRLTRVRTRMDALGVEALALSVGADLPYLVGYEAMPLERLTMLVVRSEGRPELVVPELELARVHPRDQVFGITTWGEIDDPIEIVARLLGPARRVAVGDRTWARFLVDLLAMRPDLEPSRADHVVAPVRSVKDAAEVDALAAAAAAADAVQRQLRDGEIPLAGRTEAAVAADVSRALLEAGHDKVNFAIVAGGDNAASPHHHAGGDVLQPGRSVLFDIGGTKDGYCSDITRNVFLGEPDAAFEAMHRTLEDAQAAAVAAAVGGATGAQIDAAARDHLAEAGLSEYFIHRTGHGIGLEEHEEPYIVASNTEPVAVGNAFSVEPGVYVPGVHGARIEDIVVVTEDGPRALNTVDHSLGVVEPA